MSENSKKIEVYVGEEAEVPEGAEVFDVPKPEKEEVGGRYPYTTNVICPSCCAVNQIVADTDFYKYFRCWNDGYVFTY